MFVASYFAPRYFTGSYWTKLGLQVEVPIEPPIAIGPSRPMRRPQRHDVRVGGQTLTLYCSLLPGDAVGSAKAFGDVLSVVIASGSVLQLRREVIAGKASVRIVLTDEEEIMLILADAA